jgi:GT2 family glycosyltransferase
MEVSIIIPNWNGEVLLQKHLPHVVTTHPGEILVVDDASTDSSVRIVEKFKNITLLKNKGRLGFVKSVNRGVQAAKGGIVVLLNNDVTPQKDFLRPLIIHFQKPDSFAVSCHEPDFSWAKASFDGFVKHLPGPKTDKTHVSFWASGGSAAFSKEKWQILGGMDSIYKPFYWEDIDLSYRAWKRGWKILWEPASIVHHNHGGTVEKYYSKSYREYISQRNQLIFIWKNITSEKLFSEHKKALFKKLAQGQLWRPFLGASLFIPQILKKRAIEKKEGKVTDEEIFGLFN